MSESHLANYESVSAAMDIVTDMITSYCWLFDVTSEELEKERRIQKALELLKEVKIASKPDSDDILIPVYIYDRNRGKCLTVKVS